LLPNYALAHQYRIFVKAGTGSVKQYKNMAVDNKPKQIVELERELGVKVREFTLDDAHELVMLDIIGGLLESIAPLAKYNYLEKLYLTDCGTRDISAITLLTKLKSFWSWDNPIADLSPLGALTDLLSLTLSNTYDVDFTVLQKCTNLYGLILMGCQITEIAFMQGLVNLRGLSLMDNRIQDIGPLQHLQNIRHFDFRNNQISNIEPLLPLIKKGYQVVYKEDLSNESINLYNNPLTTPPVEIVQQGNAAILDWFANYQKEQAKGELPLNEAKMIIIGEPDAGKTSLMNYLLGRPFSVPSPTEGFKREHWPVVQDNTEYRINIWDFGGQEIQSTVHQFFLTQDTLYIVVLNARKDEKPDTYLEQIKSYAPDSPVIIVINQMDENATAAIDENRLKELYKNNQGEPMLKAVFKTSLLKGHRDGDANFLPALQALEQGIVVQLMQLPNIRAKVPVTYFAVKEDLEGERFRQVPFITKSTYEQICADKNLGKASNDDLLLKLNNLGTVRYFNDVQRRDLHILNPEWLSDGVYRILMHPKTHEYKGIITEKDFPEILQKTTEQQFSYPPQYYHFLITMIETFNLGYYERETGKIFIPKAFGRDYPTGFNPNNYKKDAIHFFFKYETFIPSPIISGFIARMFGKVVDNLYWQNGLVLQQTDMEATQTALVEQNDIKNRIDIWVSGQHRQAFFIELRSIFREFHEKRQGLVVDEMVGLDERRDTAVKYKVLLAHKVKGKSEYTDDEANDYNIDKLLGLFESPSVTRAAINNQFNINNYGRLHIGDIQYIRNEAAQISADLTALLGELGEQNKLLAQQLLEGMQAIQQAPSPAQAKGIFAQLRDTITNFTKISSEEAVKWGTRKLLDSQTVRDVFHNIVEGITGLGKHFVDYIRPENLL
jgi:internalin A